MAKWQGTQVPNSGYVDKVYFNTNLSIEEVVSCIENANLTYDEDDVYFVLQGETSNNIVVVNTNGMIGIMDVDTQTIYFVSADISLGFVGWNPVFNGIIEVNSNVVSVGTDGDYFGAQNDLISALVSFTPFTQSQPTTADKLQKLINGKQYVIDKTNAKAGSDLKINSTWQSIGDVIESIESGGVLNQVYADGVEVYGVDKDGNKYLVLYEEVA